MDTSNKKSRLLTHNVFSSALLLLACQTAFAQTDIATTPVASGVSVNAKPNIMLLMKNSGTTGFTHMPDDVEPASSTPMPIGYKNYQCNLSYYNPNTTYVIPKAADGTSLPTPSFGAAYYNYFLTPSVLTNLSTSFQAWDANTQRLTTRAADTPQQAYYYLYAGPETLSGTSAPCTDADSGEPSQTTAGGGTFNRVLVSQTSGIGNSDERLNFAIWYSYYRTRMLLTKSAVSLAFSPLSSNYRVGFINTRPGNPVLSANYLPLADFDTSQRSEWFSKVFSQVSQGASPVREALARVGRHYGGKQDSINSGMTGDPVQYSCQQNFTILTTDGYWNTAAETAGPVKLDGTTLVGQQDSPLTDANGNAPRPIYDGSTDTSLIVTSQNNTYQYAPCSDGYSLIQTVQNLASTSQTSQATSQQVQSTNQNLATTTQLLQSTVQNLVSTAQTLQSTSQVSATTTQNLQSTVQNLQSTTQTLQSTAQNLATTTQNLQSTVQNLQSSVQNLQSTSQLTVSTLQNLQSTVQNLSSTTQNLKSTSQTTQSTTQNLQSTTQILASTYQVTQTATQTTQSTQTQLQSTVQNLQSTSQNVQTTSQMLQSSTQNLQSTTQNLSSTVQNLQSTAQTTQTTTQINQSTTQNLGSTVQNLQSTSQLQISTSQNLQSVAQNLRSTAQNLQSTSQTLTSTSQNTRSTTQNLESTVQNLQTQTQVRISTVQQIQYDAATELSTAVPSCTAGGTISCSTNSTGPTLVASCTASGPTAANNYTT
ncbi:MAG: hypothetical protein ACK5VR_11675, partial [Burkholderiales bacterium]